MIAKTGFRDLTRRFLGRSYSTVDALGGRRRILADLEANVVEECRLGQGLFGDRGGPVRGCPPAEEMEQIVGTSGPLAGNLARTCPGPEAGLRISGRVADARYY